MGNLRIVSGNILDYLDLCDVIVNPANKTMKAGSGLCKVIYEKANKEKLEDCCSKVFSRDMRVKEVRITKGYDLNKKIIHVCTPKFSTDINSISDLLECYINVITLAKEEKLNTILFPVLGTGINGYSHIDTCVKVIAVLREYAYRYNMDFILVIYDDNLIDLYKNVKPLKKEEYDLLSEDDKISRYMELDSKEKKFI